MPSPEWIERWSFKVVKLSTLPRPDDLEDPPCMVGIARTLRRRIGPRERYRMWRRDREANSSASCPEQELECLPRIAASSGRSGGNRDERSEGDRCGVELRSSADAAQCFLQGVHREPPSVEVPGLSLSRIRGISGEFPPSLGSAKVQVGTVAASFPDASQRKAQP